ncbi:MAG TPA: hypothetical protein VFU04_03790, partial [Solirubrobacterales bacterium]|nr:hypothetical protein [Solirubrobacterales bacterium]
WVRDRVDGWLSAPLLRRAELTLVARLSAGSALEAAGVAPILFSGAEEADRLVGLLHQRAQQLRFGLALSREWDREPGALALRRSLEARGHACALHLADEWDSLAAMTADVAVVCGEPGLYRPKPAQLNVLWAPAGIRPTRCDEWDLILVADESQAAALQTETPTLVAPLDLDSKADAAEDLLELVAGAAAREGVGTGILAQA